MSSKWRLLDTGVQHAHYNMALEKVLLTSCTTGDVPNTLHVLEFIPCVLMGYNQSVGDAIDEEFCKKNQIEINRRISGGGCIYTDGGTLGWEIIAKKGTPGIPENIESMYRKLCEGLILALAGFGVEAAYRPLNDVEVGGRKISGTGGTELSDSFIFHGTVLVDFDVETMIKALKVPLIKMSDKQVTDFKQRTVCLKELLGYAPKMSEVKTRLAAAFEKMLGIEFENGGLSAFEIGILNDELKTFASEEWIYGRHVPGKNSSLNTSEYKARGGLIRVSLLLDEARGYIKSAFITGDFFAYPERGILALENVLKNSRNSPEVITKKISAFFDSGEMMIPGAGADDFIKAIIKAAQAEKI